MGNKREPFEPNSFYHVYNHGNAEDIIFREEKNYFFFLEKFTKYVAPIAEVYAYCLIPNHFHFMVKIKRKNRMIDILSKGNPQMFKNSGDLQLSTFIAHKFGTLLNSYTKAYNKYYDRAGSLFRNTTKRKLISDSIYYTQLIRYIHLNPVKHGLVKNPEDWHHSSYKSFLSEKSTLLQRKRVLEWFGSKDEFIDVH